MIRRPFSLVEVILVIGLVALVAGVLGLRSYKAIERQRFEADVEALAARLELAAELMVSCNADVCVRIYSEPNLPLVIEVDAEGDLSSGYQRLIGRQLVLHEVGEIAFDEDRSSPLVLAFERERGLALPTGTLSVRSKKGRREVYLDLPGQPGPIRRVKEPQPHKRAPPRFPEEVLSETQSPEVS